MSPNEAALFLDLSQYDDIDEAWEFAFFEWKKKCLSLPLILKLYQSKLNKIDKINEAYCVLGGVNDDKEQFAFSEITLDQANAIELYNSFQKSKNEILQKLWKTEALNSFKLYLEQLFILRNEFYKHWTTSSFDENIKLSEVQDEMLVFNAIKEVSSKGLISVEDILKNQASVPSVLIKEIARMNKVLINDPLAKVLFA